MAVTVKIPTPLRNLTGDVAEYDAESASLTALVEELLEADARIEFCPPSVKPKV